MQMNEANFTVFFDKNQRDSVVQLSQRGVLIIGQYISVGDTDTLREAKYLIMGIRYGKPFG